MKHRERRSRRSRAVIVLLALGAAASIWSYPAKAEDADRKDVCEHVAFQGKSIQQWIAELADAHLRREALVALRAIGPDAILAEDHLMRIAREEDELRGELAPLALEALAEVGLRSSLSIDSMPRLLGSRNEEIRIGAARLVIDVPAARSEKVLHALEIGVLEGRWSGQETFALALKVIGPPASPGVIRAIEGWLRADVTAAASRAGEVAATVRRSVALNVLGTLSPRTSAVWTYVESMLGEGNPQVCASAAVALLERGISEEAAWAAVRRALQVGSEEAVFWTGVELSTLSRTLDPVEDALRAGLRRPLGIRGGAGLRAVYMVRPEMTRRHLRTVLARARTVPHDRAGLLEAVLIAAPYDDLAMSEIARGRDIPGADLWLRAVDVRRQGKYHSADVTALERFVSASDPRERASVARAIGHCRIRSAWTQEVLRRLRCDDESELVRRASREALKEMHGARK